MKKIVPLFIIIALALTACGGKTTALIGQGEGYGGIIRATVSVQEGKIKNVSFEGTGETPSIGGAALEKLAASIEKAGTPDVDAISGATVTSKGALYAVHNAMDSAEYPYPAQNETRTQVLEPETAIPDIGALSEGLRLGQALYAAHGDKGFALTTVALDGERVLAVYLDEYQFQTNAAAVPNSAGAFGESYFGEAQLASKRANNESYSAAMTQYASATRSYYENLLSIEAYVTGKTISELKALVENEASAVVDAVSGATLVDTRGYIMSVLAAAAECAQDDPVTYEGNRSALKLGRVEGAAHGDKAFTVAAVLTDGETIVLSYLDEFQPTTASETLIGVPGSNGAFAEGFAADTILISKRYNHAYYSSLMAEHGGSTTGIAENFNAIEQYANGKQISALAREQEEGIDAVSGATLVDVAGYLQVIIDAAYSA